MIYIIIGIIIGLYIAITEGWMNILSDICTNIIETIVLPLGCGFFGLLAWGIIRQYNWLLYANNRHKRNKRTLCFTR